MLVPSSCLKLLNHKLTTHSRDSTTDEYAESSNPQIDTEIPTITKTSPSQEEEEQDTETEMSSHRSHHHSSSSHTHSHSHSSSSKHSWSTSSSSKGKSKSKSHSSKHESDDWSEITDPEERRRVQNRIAQRKFSMSPLSPSHSPLKKHI